MSCRVYSGWENINQKTIDAISEYFDNKYIAPPGLFEEIGRVPPGLFEESGSLSKSSKDSREQQGFLGVISERGL